MKHTRFKRGVARSYILFFSFLFPLSSFLFAFAVTYRVNPANGPETLATEVKEAFDAWVALSEKIEVSETEENPEGIFQYGATERFGPDTLSLTVQRQADTRSLIYLISPNAENRKRILLHETGIAIGLTPQIPGTPLTSIPTPTPPTEETPTGEDGETLEPETSEDTQSSEEGTTEEQQTTDEQQTSDEQTTTEEPSTTEEQSTEEQSTEDESTAEDQPTTTEETSESSDTTSTESETESTGETSTTEETSESSETTDTTSTDSSTETTEPSETPEPTLTPNSVMNPSIGPDDSTELGDFEKQLINNLELFVSQDINRDGVVNFYDLVALSQAFGRRDVNDPADINKDGIVDQGDVDELQSVYTFSDPSETAPGSSPTTEEEPTDGTTPPEDTGLPPDALPPPQEDGTLPDDGSGE